MDLVGDRRGQSIQIGAVLLFGVLIISFSSYQAFVVPNQNNEVEFNHNQEVQSQMQDLRNAVVSVPGSTSTQAVSIELSTRYPSRLVARNPGPLSGSLRTNGTSSMRYNITVRNAAAAGETGDLWDGTARPYNTGTIAYSPNYNVYTNAPTTYYGQSVAYNQFRAGNITISDQAMVNGRDITLVALNGSLSRSASGTTSVDVRPVSRSEDPIVVSNDGAAANVSVSVPTRLPQSVWEELLADEIDGNPGDLSNDRYVADVTATDGPGPYYNLTITFERGADYRLRMAKAGVGDGFTSEGAAYLTDIRGDGSSVANGATTEVVLEVRDEYNNPVQGVTVSGGVDPSDDGSLTESEKVSGSDGRVTFEYDANGVTPGTQRVNFSYPGLDGGFDGSTPEDVTMEVEVTSSGGGGNGGGSGGSGPSEWIGYVNSNDNLAIISNDNTVDTFTVGTPVGIGPFREDIDGDGNNELPFVDDNDDIAIVDRTDTTSEIIDGTNSALDTHLGVGDWDGDDTIEVVYVGQGDMLYSASSDGNPNPITDNNGDTFGALSVAGIGDIDGDSSPEIVFVDDANILRYIDQTGNSGQPKQRDIGTTVNQPNAIGRLADYTGDGTVEVPVYDPSDKGIDIVNQDSNVEIDLNPSTDLITAPMGAFDYVGDSTPEIIYVGDSNNYIRYVNPDNGNSGVVKSEQVDNNVGAS